MENYLIILERDLLEFRDHLSFMKDRERERAYSCLWAYDKHMLKWVKKNQQEH